MYAFETTCAVQIRAQAAGTVGNGQLGEGDPATRCCAAATEQARMATLGRSGPGALIWPGLLRRLDRTDPSHRH